MTTKPDDLENYTYPFWGKYTHLELEGIHNYHPLIHHSLDVSAVGYYLLSKESRWLANLSSVSQLPPEKARTLATFFLAIHDLGKFADGFQNLIPALFSELRGKTSLAEYHTRHDSLGFEMWTELGPMLYESCPALLSADLEPMDCFDFTLPWARAVFGHHGKPPILSTSRYSNSCLGDSPEVGAQALQAAKLWIEATLSLFSQSSSVLEQLNCKHEDAFIHSSWLLAGISVAADWLGSNQLFFPYIKEAMSPEDYWQEHALPKARRAVAESGLLCPKPSSNLGISGLFPNFKKPSPLQKWASDVDLHSGPQLFIIEEATGGGKTEAALVLAHRLMSAGLAESVYVGMPTMATANAMYGRLSEVYQRLFEHSNMASPSLLLSHSARNLSNQFLSSISMEQQRPDSNYSLADVSASAQCTQWLADTRKKSILAPVGVGTIDQALVGILPSKHQSLRLTGLSRSVFVVDEVHAYDAYTNKLLKRLLKFHFALGGSAILLSATIPLLLRRDLCTTYTQTSESQIETSYPLATHVTAENIVHTQIESRSDIMRSINISSTDVESSIIDSLLSAAQGGHCACWIRNTVDDALAAYIAIRDRLGPAKVHLFHARYALGDRLRIEAEILARFGKTSTAVHRAGHVVIATQVIEQSLDLDFDLMATDLAPIDSILQRVGRLHRHRRSKSGNPQPLVAEGRGPATLLLLCPKPISSAGSKWYESMFPTAAFVYPMHGQLWLTARQLTSMGTIRLPEQNRELIEAVYSDQALEKVPAALLKRQERAEGEAHAGASVAHMSALRLDEGYQYDNQFWLEDTQVLTRLSKPSTRIRLAKVQCGAITPWSDDLHQPWAFSELTVPQSKVAQEATFSLDLAEGVQDAKRSMRDKGKWSVMIPMSKRTDSIWCGRALNTNGLSTGIVYDSNLGLKWE